MNFIDSDAGEGGTEPGTALRLSGGGYRAMVFHLGPILRLNETGLLPKLKRIFTREEVFRRGGSL